VMAIVSAALLNACNSNSETSTSSDTTTTMGTDTSSTMSGTNTSMDTTTISTTAAPLEKMDRDFVMKAASGGLMEVELGNIAQQNAASQRVKDFGSMMVRDHSAANQELMSFANRRNLTMNSDSLTNLHKAHVDALKNKKGAAFDKAYMNMMVSDHKKDVSEFDKASKMCKDQECLAFAAKTLPTLQMHLDSAQAISKVIK